MGGKPTKIDVAADGIKLAYSTFKEVPGVFLIKNLTDDTLTLTVKPAGNDEFIETKVYPGWNPEIISEIQGAQENQLQYGY